MRETLRVLPPSYRSLFVVYFPSNHHFSIPIMSFSLARPPLILFFFPFVSICSFTPNPFCFLLFFPFSLPPNLSYPDEEEFKVFGPRRCGRLCQRTSGKKNIPNSNSHNLPLSYSKIHIASLSISIPSALYIHIASPSHTP